MAPKFTNGRYDWEQGVEVAEGRPRAYQPRAGGPPLLFATDVRMTILATLAEATGPLRCVDLWRTIGRKNFGCLTGLVQRGLVAKWRLGNFAYVSLESTHPASTPLRHLLSKIGRHYGLARPIEQESLFEKPAAPKRRRRIDARLTFGDVTGTVPLLMVYIRLKANAEQVARCIPRCDVKSARQALKMFKAFGILRSERISRGVSYSLNPDHVLAKELRAVLHDLDVAMPQWRVVAENDIANPRRRPRENRAGRRKPKRWKW